MLIKTLIGLKTHNIKRKLLQKSILVWLLAIVVCSSGFSQVSVERSKDKAVISGVVYYLHLVKKGETLFSISKAYGITPNDIVKNNPTVADGLKEGQSLRIPERLVSTAPSLAGSNLQQKVHDNDRFIYHILQPGETIYSLSKRYNVSEYDILKSNQGIDIYKISSGTEIAIPRPLQFTQEKEQTPQKTGPYYHKVVKGETMSSIARHYEITVRELRRANRDVRFPQVGDYLQIPGMEIAIREPVEETKTDSLATEEDESELFLGRLEEKTPVKSLEGSFNVALLLPFYLRENAIRTEIDSSKYQKGRKIYTIINRPEEWIYPPSLGFLEMYEGVLLAADTLRSLGLNINLYVLDIRSDTVEVARLIRSGQLDNMDLIIGPVHSNNLSLIASYAGRLGIPVVSPVPLYNNSVLWNNPLLFMANSSLEVAQKSIANKIKDYYNKNIIFIHSDSLNNDPEVISFRYKLLSSLNSVIPPEKVKFRELLFRSRSTPGYDPDEILNNLLSQDTENIVVIGSDNPPVMIESIQELYNHSKKSDIKVFGYPEMRQLLNIDPKFFYELGLMIYTPYWIDYSNQNVKQFCKNFMAKFHTIPSEMSYAWEGYDIMYYFLGGLSLFGKEFTIHPEMFNPRLIYSDFDFRRDSFKDGFENQKLYLIRYTNNYDIELVDNQVNYTAR
jgi:LysM repeat protein/ABC-type branched-subunit amino acid transport system substrate-binding protein